MKLMDQHRIVSLPKDGSNRRRGKQRFGIGDAVLGQRGEPGVPVGGEAQRRRAAPLGPVRARIKPVEHRDRQAVVVAVAFGDDFAILPDLVDGAVEGAVVEFIGEPRAAHRQRRVPAGGEQPVAIAQRIGRLAAALDLAAGIGDHPARGEHVEKGGAHGRGPAVAAVMAGFGLDRVEAGGGRERRRLVGRVTSVGEDDSVGSGRHTAMIRFAHTTRNNLFGSCRKEKFLLVVIGSG